ncbi:MAG: MopE-related protein [Polyangiaceae bacterium]
MLASWLGAPAVARAADLLVDGSVAGPATCPDGGTAVAADCTVSATAANNRGCRYGGSHQFGVVSVTNGGWICTVSYNGADKSNSGNVVIRADSILVDATSRITAKGAGYRGRTCDEGEGATATEGGRGGCSVLDSGGGGGHFGAGGRGTKDCFLVAPANSCQFPQEWEEDCGNLAPGGGSCVATTDPQFPVCYGTTNTPDGAGNALPSVAGQPYQHSIYDAEFGGAGGDKGCRDGFDNAKRAGNGGGRIVLFAANVSQTGVVNIAGKVNADGFRGCSSGNDSAGGGAGGSILIIGDNVVVNGTARVSAHGGRGGDSQPKCLPCTNNTDCNAGQTCSGGRCGPCNCTPCSSNAQCNALLGQTCKNLGGDLGSVCADATNQCTPFDPGENDIECRATQNNGTCDDCAGGGGGGIVNIQSRSADIDPAAVFDVRGAPGGICPICSGESGGGAGELQIDGGYDGEICDGYDNDFNGLVDDNLPLLVCPDGTTPPSCIAGVPQICDYDPATCTVASPDARPRFALIVDTSGSMLNDLAGNPTFGDGSVDYPGVDTASDADTIAGNNSRLFIAKEALTQVLAAFPESDFALGRYSQDVGVNRSCQTASNFECASSCCSYDDPTNNLPPQYPSTYPGNTCVLSTTYPAAGYPATADFTSNIEIGWPQEGMESPPTSDCINYAGSCGPPRRGAQFLVGFGQPINRYLAWLDGVEDPDATFDATTTEGNHCPSGNCELRGTGPTPLGGALDATYDFLTPIVTCDGAAPCRSYSVILLTDGAESCNGNPQAAAASLFAGINGKAVKTYVIGFSVLASEQTQLNAIAAAGGTGSAFFVQSKSQLADALAQIIGEDQRFELCNDLDDDCDTLVDEDFPEKGLPCTDGELGLCLGTGTFQCLADGTGTSCVITNPGASPTAEICNQLDDDCDGLVDEDDMGLPLPCTGCVPSPEICDGVDNDCDLAIDEQADVEANQPMIYGVPCGSLTAPNDQPPCSLGTVVCINASPVCIGYKGPGNEICNGKDDDCDGVGDDMAMCPGDTQCVEAQCVLPCDTGEFPCPNGYACDNGFCFPVSCADVMCDPNEVCQNGVCVPAGSGGGSAGGAGGTAAQGGAAGGDEGGTSNQGGESSNGGTSNNGGAAPNNKANWGLATGGGGCSCNVVPARSTPSAALAVATLVAALGLRRRSSAKRGEVRR